MSISVKTQQRLALALTSTDAANEIVSALSTDGAHPLTPQAPPTVVAVTFTAGGTPSAYTTPTGAVTVANSTTPTVVELLDYCNELRGVITALTAKLVSAGVLT